MGQRDPFDRAIRREQEIRRSRFNQLDEPRFIMRWMSWVTTAVFLIWAGVVVVHYLIAGEANTAFTVHLIVYCTFVALAVVAMVAIRVLLSRLGELSDPGKPPT